MQPQYHLQNRTTRDCASSCISADNTDWNATMGWGGNHGALDTSQMQTGAGNSTIADGRKTLCFIRLRESGPTLGLLGSFGR